MNRNTVIIILLISCLGFSTSGFGDVEYNSGDLGSSSFHVIQSLDKHEVSAFSDNSMGLMNAMKTQLTVSDGSLEKSRYTAMLSYGAENLNLFDTSNLVVQDSLGRKTTSGFEKSVTLANCQIPFALIREDLTKVSGQATADLSGSKITIFLPTFDGDNGKISEMGTILGKSLGDSKSITIKTFKWNNKNDISSMFKELNLDKYFDASQWNDWMSLFSDPKMWAALEAARESNTRPSVEDLGANFFEENGGLSCRWGYAE